MPLPGFRASAETARAGLAIGLTMALASRWPALAVSEISAGRLAALVVAEATIGLAIGVSTAIVLEAFPFAAQVLGMQAGYGYASTIDPNSEADSGVLVVFAQLIAGMLFFALGLDREVLRLFAYTLDRIPPGAYTPTAAAAEIMTRLGGTLFTAGVRLALPVVALLLLVDMALGLLGRLNQQLQLISLAFSLKMLIAILVLSWTASMFPRVMAEVNALAAAASLRALGI